MNKVRSSKPKKQRRFHYHKPLHRKQQSLAAHLDKRLSQQLRTRSIPLRKGDHVKVLRGTKKGTSGKITAVDYKKGVVFVDKLVRKKASGEEIPLPVHASNLLVTELDKSDAKRFGARKPAKEGKEKTEKKSPEEKEETTGKEKAEKKKREEKGEIPRKERKEAEKEKRRDHMKREKGSLKKENLKGKR